MKKFLFRVIKSVMAIMLVAIVLTSCVPSNETTEMPEEAKKFLGTAQNYASKQNLNIIGYAGKTIIRTKDYDPAVSAEEPVVYEWKAENPTTKEQYYVQVGPVMPMFKKAEPGVMVSEKRYQLDGKVVNLEENEEIPPAEKQ